MLIDAICGDDHLVLLSPFHLVLPKDEYNKHEEKALLNIRMLVQKLYPKLTSAYTKLHLFTFKPLA